MAVSSQRQSAAPALPSFVLMSAARLSAALAAGDATVLQLIGFVLMLLTRQDPATVKKQLDHFFQKVSTLLFASILAG